MENQEETFIGYFDYYKGFKGSIKYLKDDKTFYGNIIFNFNTDLVTYQGSDILSLYDNFKQAVDDYIETKNSVSLMTSNQLYDPVASRHNSAAYIEKYYSNKLCNECANLHCKIYGARCKKYRIRKLLGNILKRNLI